MLEMCPFVICIEMDISMRKKQKTITARRKQNMTAQDRRGQERSSELRVTLC